LGSGAVHPLSARVSERLPISGELRRGRWGRGRRLAGRRQHACGARAGTLIRLVLPALLALLLATPAVGQEPSQDTLRAGQVQVQADEAFRAGRYDDALTLAGRAISLDPAATTWLAQQIRVEVLERQERYDEAMAFLRDYLALEGLFPEHRAWGQEAEARIGGVLEQRRARDAEVKAKVTGRRGAGIGLMVGGAIPLGVGIGFAANFGHNGADVQRYGGWLDSGLVLVGVGTALEVFGLVLVLTADPKDGGGVALRPLIAGPGGGANGLMLEGTF
jgi:tetratricopeptide (TPR) repeat protein